MANDAFHLDRWRDAWTAVGATPPDGLHAAIVAAYTEPHRAYHTLQHLAECFAAFDDARHLAPHSAEVELALWFHDAVYDTHARDSEDRSATWAHDALIAGGVSPDVAARVRDLVLATKHDAVPSDDDARLLVDVDLAILGAPPTRFDEYEAQVRHEYAWVPDDAFREGRRRVLETFLARPAIYGTASFARLDAPARENLARSIAALG